MFGSGIRSGGGGVSRSLERSKLQAVERSVRDSIEQVDRLDAVLQAILHDISKMRADFQGGMAQQTIAEVDEPERTMDSKTDTVEADLRRLAREFHILSSVALYDTEDELEEAVLHAQELARLIE